MKKFSTLLTESMGGSPSWKDKAAALSKDIATNRHSHDGGHEWTSTEDHKTTRKQFREHLKELGHGNIRGERSGDDNEHYFQSTPPHARRQAHTLETEDNGDGTYTHNLYTSVQANHH